MNHQQLLRDIKELIKQTITLVLMIPYLAVVRPFTTVIFAFIDLLFNWLSQDEPVEEARPNPNGFFSAV